MARRKHTRNEFRAKLSAAYDQARSLGLRWATGRVRHHDYEAAMVALDVWEATGVFTHPTLRLEPPLVTTPQFFVPSAEHMQLGTTDGADVVVLGDPHVRSRARMGWITDDRSLTAYSSRTERGTGMRIALTVGPACAAAALVGIVVPNRAGRRVGVICTNADGEDPWNTFLTELRRTVVAAPTASWVRGKHQPRHTDTANAFASVAHRYQETWYPPVPTEYVVAVCDPVLIGHHDVVSGREIGSQRHLVLVDELGSRLDGWFVWARLPAELCAACWRCLYAGAPLLERCAMCEGHSSLDGHIEHIVRVGRYGERVGRYAHVVDRAGLCEVRAVLCDGRIEMEQLETGVRFAVGCTQFAMPYDDAPGDRRYLPCPTPERIAQGLVP